MKRKSDRLLWLVIAGMIAGLAVLLWLSSFEKVDAQPSGTIRFDVDFTLGPEPIGAQPVEAATGIWIAFREVGGRYFLTMELVPSDRVTPATALPPAFQLIWPTDPSWTGTAIAYLITINGDYFRAAGLATPTRAGPGEHYVGDYAIDPTWSTIRIEFPAGVWYTGGRPNAPIVLEFDRERWWKIP